MTGVTSPFHSKWREKGERKAHAFVIACFRQLSFRQTMRKAIHGMALVVAILCATACFNHGSRQLDSKGPDRVLFDKAAMAVQEKRFTVANLTLQTLVNTYPASEYADRARAMLQDPQIARCGEGFSSTPNLCEPERH